FNVVPKTDTGDLAQEFTATEATVGLRAKKTFGLATVRLETGGQLGERAGSQADVYAYHVDADVMVSAAERLILGVGGQYASGDDPDSESLESWNQLYPTAHKFLGLMDVMGGRSNVASGIGKLRAPLRKDLKLGLDAHLFFRPETPSGVDSYTGFETDAWAALTLGRGLSLRCMYAAFVPHQDGPFGEDSPAHYGELQLRYKR
ncbi:MAG: alginate export family protein, partial [Deltaproteobacteria bacterium]|nr:alginate export family protein [Deltaproteobacteria bacterium]